MEWSAPKGQVLVNIRIPKTAGTSLTAILAEAYSHAKVVYTDDFHLSNLTDMSAGARLDVGMVAGHILHGIGRLFLQRAVYITMLRDPAERIYSFYRYVRREDEHPINILFLDHDYSFGEFLELGLSQESIRREVDNGQVRRLAGDMSPASFPDTPILYRRALHNLSAPDMLFGVSENFEGFLRRLVADGVLPDVRAVHANTSPGTEPVLEEALADATPAQLQLLQDFIGWDQLLYNSASAVALLD